MYMIWQAATTQLSKFDWLTQKGPMWVQVKLSLQQLEDDKLHLREGVTEHSWAECQHIMQRELQENQNTYYMLVLVLHALSCVQHAVNIK